MHVVPRIVAPVLFAVLAAPLVAAEMFRDLELAGGVNLSNVSTALKPLETGTILRGEGGIRQEWRLAQWGTHFDLKDGGERSLPGGTRIIRNPGKTVTVRPGGLAGEGVTLEVAGGMEFSAGLRKEGEAWPHLLLEQKIPKDFRLADRAALNFKLSFRVDHCRNAVSTGLNPDLHTAQATAYWTIHNRNPESADFEDMIWFGVPLFDARHEVPPGHKSLDEGSPESTGKFICTMEGSRFYSGPTGDFQWHDLSCDLVPLVKEALAAAQAEGHLTATAFEDLHATSFNIGWEVPGPYDCSITLKGLSLDYTGEVQAAR